MTKSASLVLLLILATILFSSGIEAHYGNYKNLQVLPKYISEKQLDSIMDSYNAALKVSCDFCHTKSTDAGNLLFSGNNAPLDFAADNGMKEEARRMMRLTIDVNKRYFNNDTLSKRPDYLLNVVTCNTCHRGNPYPAHE
jgi:hypothetical protein